MVRGTVAIGSPTWNNSTVITGDVVDGTIVVPASFQLVQTLIEHDLVDELRLKIYPVLLGTGARIFGEISDKKPMRLVDTQTLAGGIVYLVYELRP